MRPVLRWLLWAVGLLVLSPGCVATEQADKAGKADTPVVRSAECRWLRGRIRLDGVVDEVVWDDAQALEHFAVFWQGRPARTKTTARLLWDRTHLYFAADMEDEDLYATVKERNGQTWHDDVFELFFRPTADKLPYYEFQVNALNTQLELFLPSRGAGGYDRFAPLTRLGMESAVKLRGTLNNWEDRDKGWSVEGRIPWTAFNATGGRPKPGDRWRFALCRYDYSVTLDQPELSSTAPLTKPDFHRYEDYGELIFVGPKE
jgi:hypothetical protein